MLSCCLHREQKRGLRMISKRSGRLGSWCHAYTLYCGTNTLIVWFGYRRTFLYRGRSCYRSLWAHLLLCLSGGSASQRQIWCRNSIPNTICFNFHDSKLHWFVWMQIAAPWIRERRINFAKQSYRRSHAFHTIFQKDRAGAISLKPMVNLIRRCWRCKSSNVIFKQHHEPHPAFGSLDIIFSIFCKWTWPS